MVDVLHRLLEMEHMMYNVVKNLVGEVPFPRDLLCDLLPDSPGQFQFDIRILALIMINNTNKNIGENGR